MRRAYDVTTWQLKKWFSPLRTKNAAIRRISACLSMHGV